MAYKTSSWDLREITPKNIDLELKEIGLLAAALEKKRNLLTNNISANEFLSLVKEFEQLRVKISKISSYTSLKFSENTADQQIGAEMSKVETALAKISNKLLFFSLWFKDMPEAKAKELINASGPYRYHFEQLRVLKPYTLQEREEQIINLKDTTGVSALNNIYNILTSQFKFSVQGKEITQEELLSLCRSSSKNTRQEAYTQLLTKYREYNGVIGEIYKNVVNDWREEHIGLRGYKSPISVRNIANDIPDKAVEALLKVCDKNQHLFQRFFEIKRNKLGIKNMTRFDIYASVEEKQQKTAYHQAAQMVLESFDAFSPLFREKAETILDSNHVHSQVQKKKMSGAFCANVNTKIPPYVLLNYTGDLRCVSTLAHELGHGVHDMLSSIQTEFTHQACLPLAETASILSEMLLTQSLMKQDPKKASVLLFYKLDDLYASIIRQASFVNFEIKAHLMMEQGKTIQEISDCYLLDLKKQLGSKITVDKLFAYEWMYVSHFFHAPFYCYAYAFGNLLTLALYEMYEEQGEEMVPKIIEMLSKGGSESPVKITDRLGIDISSEEFWQKGFLAIEKMIRTVDKNSWK